MKLLIHLISFVVFLKAFIEKSELFTNNQKSSHTFYGNHIYPAIIEYVIHMWMMDVYILILVIYANKYTL